MSGRRARNDGASVSLFPFLAVLLCTIGSLIVILVVVAKQARANAVRESQRAESKDSEKREAEQEVAEDLAWDIEQLSAARDQSNESLARSRQ